MESVIELKGANMDIDHTTKEDYISWKQDKCAVKNISICKYFEGIKPLDTVLCSYKK